MIPTTTRLADPAARATGVVGPAFAGGGTVVWGEQTRGGRITVNVADGGRLRDIGTAYFPRAVRHDLPAGGGLGITAMTVSGRRLPVLFGVVGGVPRDLSSAPGGGRVALAGGTIGVRRADGTLALYDARNDQKHLKGGTPVRVDVRTQVARRPHGCEFRRTSQRLRVRA